MHYVSSDEFGEFMLSGPPAIVEAGIAERKMLAERCTVARTVLRELYDDPGLLLSDPEEPLDESLVAVLTFSDGTIKWVRWPADGEPELHEP